LGLAWGIKSLDHPQVPRGARHRVNHAGARISSIALTLRLAVGMGTCDPPIGAHDSLLQDSQRECLLQGQLSRTSRGRVGSTLVNVTIAFCRQRNPGLIVSCNKTTCLDRSSNESAPRDLFARYCRFPATRLRACYRDGNIEPHVAGSAATRQFVCYISDIFFSGMPVPPTAFPWPFKFASGGVRTCAKPSEQSQKGISSSTVTGVWPGGSRFGWECTPTTFGSITTSYLVHGF